MQVQSQLMEQEHLQGESDYDYYTQNQENYEGEPSLQENEPPLNIHSVQALPDIIHQDVLAKQTICCMEYGPTLQLYSVAHFNSEEFDGLMDAEQTGRRLVNYKEDFKISSNEGYCRLCDTDCVVIKNSCDHALCFACWNKHISDRTQDLTNPELFPICPSEACSFFAHYQILETCWVFNPLLKAQFQKLLCIKYCKRSTTFKVCPNMGCGKVINTSHIHESTVTCECGRDMCRHCGKSSHEPLGCSDMQKWNTLDGKGEGDPILEEPAQIVKAIYCPSCQAECVKEVEDTTIETICQCGRVFCWRCMETMQRHNVFNVCENDPDGNDLYSFIKERPKPPQPSQHTRRKLEDIDSTIERILNIDIDTLKNKLFDFLLTENNSNVLTEMRNFLVETLQLIKRCHIYIFLELEDFHLLDAIITHLTTSIDQAVKFLKKTLPEWQLGQEFTWSLRNQQPGMTMNDFYRKKFLKAKGIIQEFMNTGRRVMRKLKEGRVVEAFEAIGEHEQLRSSKDRLFDKH